MTDPLPSIKKKTIPSTWVKICGLTEPENALGCAGLGADAIGLVFFKKSPRNVSVRKAAEISNVLPAHIKPIGVFVDESYDTIMDRVDRCALQGVQLHGNESPQLVKQLIRNGLLVIKALFASKPPFLAQSKVYEQASFLLVEYGKGTLPGGNAEAWNYEISRELTAKTPLILAGGLAPHNIIKAMALSNPCGVDVSSGVEKSHGIKDLEKVSIFITKVRSFRGSSV